VTNVHARGAPYATSGNVEHHVGFHVDDQDLRGLVVRLEIVEIEIEWSVREVDERRRLVIEVVVILIE
jgi:hypothetical protein